MRIEFFGDEIECIREVDVFIGEIIGEREYVFIFLVFYFVIRFDIMKKVIVNIKVEFEDCF